ncbi:hypothetical protein SPFL3102_00165 [Sporomusaceae bacterium FL31]|nr:hypothetical protein SPFL3101_02576 [Sporomusaceae bacterium FL31]GCE32390.1 hypothetical protein SPFL3102_00165 [Sporomusaceae bacterium]
MNIQVQQGVSIMDNLQNVFNYVFVQTSMYHFIVPKADKYVAVNIYKKICRCMECEATFEVDFNYNGAVHIEKSRLQAQQGLYDRLGLTFPKIEDGEPFIYNQVGYCDSCFSERLQNQMDSKQAAYNLCRQINQLDKQFVLNAVAVMDQVVLKWLESIKSLEQLTEYDLTSYLSIREILSTVIASDEAVANYIGSYKMQFAELTQRLTGYLDEFNDNKFTAIVGKPLNIYESLADDIYNEYTVLFPVESTLDLEFYSESQIQKDRIIMFLEQIRIDHGGRLIQEVGFADKWIEWLVNHVAKLES